jgi:hypothetical protein
LLKRPLEILYQSQASKVSLLYHQIKQLGCAQKYLFSTKKVKVLPIVKYLPNHILKTMRRKGECNLEYRKEKDS